MFLIGEFERSNGWHGDPFWRVLLAMVSSSASLSLSILIPHTAPVFCAFGISFPVPSGLICFLER